MGVREMKTARNLFLLLAGVLLLAGCQKEGRIGGKDAIQFTVGTPGTKTAYSGVVDGGKERINWEVGDEIRIYSDKAEHRYNEGQHWAEYVIKSVDNNGAVSKAKIDNVPGDGTGNGLVWNQPGDYKFFAIYPNLDFGGSDGEFYLTIPSIQVIDMALREPYTSGMDKAYMTAAQKVTTSEEGDGPGIQLEFKPAYTAFEFSFDADMPLEIISATLIAETEEDAHDIPLSGRIKVSYDEDMNPSYESLDPTAPQNFIAAPFVNGHPSVSQSNSITFTLFAVPLEITNLKISLNVKAEGWETSEARILRLYYKNGETVKFAGGNKHRIKATVQGAWNFKSITLNGEAVDWTVETITTNSNETPQSTQFAVTGAGIKNVYELHKTDANKVYRQTWVLGENTANVSFKIFSPVGGEYKVKPYVKKADGTIVEGSDGFTITGDLTGDIGIAGQEHVATKVKFTVAANGAANGDQLFFVTTVKDTDDVLYNLDSETQLFDTRGYHYFMVNDPLE
jgi:hypothetical protein